MVAKCADTPAEREICGSNHDLLPHARVCATSKQAYTTYWYAVPAVVFRCGNRPTGRDVGLGTCRHSKNSESCWLTSEQDLLSKLRCCAPTPQTRPRKSHVMDVGIYVQIMHGVRCLDGMHTWPPQQHIFISRHHKPAYFSLGFVLIGGFPLSSHQGQFFEVHPFVLCSPFTPQAKIN